MAADFGMRGGGVWFAPGLQGRQKRNIFRMTEDFDNREIAGFAFLARFFALGISQMRSSHKFALPALAAFCLLSAGCAVMKDYEKNQAKAREDRAMAALRSQALAENAVFRSQAGWKKKTWRNETLLAQATPENISVEISLSDQRGLLLVNGAIASDFPVATGKAGHATPPGSFSVRSKQKVYSSNLYGKIYDVTGAVLVNSADSRKHAVPEGGNFAGAPMPFWMRLTDTGVGMHVGYVPGGRAASHGCIRLKRDTASKLYEIVTVGTPVVIAAHAPALSGQ